MSVRLADLGVAVGTGTAGPLNAITDVRGVRVGHCTLIDDIRPRPVRTGVTVIQPRPGVARDEPCFAGVHSLNGNGDMTGLEWLREAGILATPIALTNTHSVGVVRDALVAAELRERSDDGVYWSMPVVGETYDGLLNDVEGQHVRAQHVDAAIAAAASGPVAEGSVGGGTGMVCHELKGGVGTASRVVATGWTVGVLVQANHGVRRRLCVDGYPVGRVLGTDRIPIPDDDRPALAGAGSIVAVVATNAPLLGGACARLAQRATIGVARTGGGVEDSSGDIFVAFATGNTGIPRTDYAAMGEPEFAARSVSNDRMTELFEAAADATEEAIVNALLAADGMTGPGDVRAHGLDAELLLGALSEVGWRG